MPFPMQRIDRLSGGGEPFCRGNILWCWTHCGQMAPLGARPRLVCAHGPASTRMTQTRADELPSPQDIYNELKPLLGIIVAGELATTVKVGQELRGAGRWRSALTIATARRREPRCATEATNVRPIVVPSAKRFGAHSALPWEVPVCASRRIVATGMSLWFFSVQHARR